ncbi:flagellar hook-length control protein FliK [Bradyrhizobium cosmicum]|uniref:flagellar hook-length control protein FliK n=1 Tax=Bradyrhizobium cosmicum TaxID=1404864 RepID=UPI001164BA1E|nr:flagellar hook-length control protein FliK [Bradyrhizobium cosmicum]QDP21878.1 flagellar hook-length control protein FliK [Bradyrhizobium cosmicum]
MTKLSGTSGQVFSGLAESLNIRGTSRSGKNAGAKSSDSSFNDLLHTVSNLAKRALKDDGGDTGVKAASLRTRLAHPTGKDKTNDETVNERTETADEPKSAHKSSVQKVDETSQTPGAVDSAPKADVSNRSGIPAIVGQELATVPVAKPQTQSIGADRKDAPARDAPSSTPTREVQATGMAKVATADFAPGARPSTAAAQAPATVLPGNEASSRAMPATQGFEAVTANVERAVKASARETLPETTKVTVVQQETHLPPAQFGPTQQIANAVVTELKESSAPTASAAADLATSQTNASEPLKILTINLEPPSLGNVTVRLRLVGSEVSVHLAAERKDTSLMLDQQRDSIRDLMHSAGYVADVAPVQHGSRDGFQSGSGQSQPQLAGQQHPSSQSQGSFDGASNSSGRSDGGARQARQEPQSNQETRHDQDVGPQIRRGPVYL